jgi:hypothetical protein
VHGPHGGDEGLVGLEPVAGEEARRPQHAERVVGEGLLRRQRRAQAPARQVGGATEGVDQRRVAGGSGSRRRHQEGHGVDREVTTGEVGLHGVGEGDVRLAGVGAVRLGPVRRDLEVATGLAAADGAEALPLGPHRIGPPPHGGLDVVGPRIGGEVEVLVLGVRSSSRSRTEPPTR